MLCWCSLHYPAPTKSPPSNHHYLVNLITAMAWSFLIRQLKTLQVGAWVADCGCGELVTRQIEFMLVDIIELSCKVYNIHICVSIWAKTLFFSNLRN